jgi:predicted DNA-binding transcriptional regulator AlpA
MATTRSEEFQEARLLTAVEVANALQIPKASLYAQRHRGAAPGSLGLKVGRFLRWRQADLAAWLDRQAADSARGRDR